MTARRWRRYQRLWRRNPAADIDDEFSFHLQERIDLSDRTRARSGNLLFTEWSEKSRTLEKSATCSFNLTGAGEPERISGARVTSGFFDVQYMPPATRRYFRRCAQESEVCGSSQCTTRLSAVTARSCGCCSARLASCCSSRAVTSRVLAQSTATRTFNMLLLTLLGVTALVLATIGIYGVISFLGILLRGTAAFWATKVLRSLLFEVQITDPLTYLSAVALLGAVTIAAALVPARRAARAEPGRSLVLDQKE